MAKLPTKDIAESLLKWYDQNARILPWRERPEPYRVWVSEIMLQQTQVKTVLPYFERFVETLRDVNALAQADEAQVFKLWEGLGYYNRVRNMQRTAKILVSQYAGELPADYDLLIKLPGLGAYTAGAIASIAYNIPVPAVDGNVLRVLSRVTGSLEDISKQSVKKEFQTLAKTLQPQGRPGDFNQGLMELGARICLPKAMPLCASCPLKPHCTAHRESSTFMIPVKSEKKTRKVELKSVLIIRTQNQVLLRRRIEKGLLAGLWELLTIPGFTTEEGVMEILDDYSLVPISIRKVEASKHLFTHIEWQLQAYLIEIEEPITPEGFTWADYEAIRTEITIPSAFNAYRKYLPKALFNG